MNDPHQKQVDIDRANGIKKRIYIYEQEDGIYCADRPHRAGMYIVGRGKNWKEALGDLLLQCSYEGVEAMQLPPYVCHKDGTPFRFKEPKR